MSPGFWNGQIFFQTTPAICFTRAMIFFSERKLVRRSLFFWPLFLLVGCVSRPFGEAAYHEVVPGVGYAHLTQPKVPWSIHVVKFDSSRPELKLASTLGNGMIFGMSTVADQIKAIPHEAGQPIAGVNADFFIMAKRAYQGDPHGVHILNGEMVSSPSKELTFWTDPAGEPHVGKVVSKMKVIWPNRSETPIGINEEPTNNIAALLSPILGPSTRNTNALELVLEPDGDGPWLPLRANEIYSARVREIRRTGNSPLTTNSLVLSFAKKAAARLPKLEVGMRLKISTELSPGMKGIQMAVGGYPVLVAHGKSLPHQPPGKADHMNQRNPRTAIGWDGKEIFLVVVDGRKADLSVGMTLPELANLMVDLGCTDALNLDGGGSTTMWLDGKVINRPSEGVERHVGNSLVLVRKPEAR